MSRTRNTDPGLGHFFTVTLGDKGETKRVGMGGFEPPTSRTLSECANRTALHPGPTQK